MRTHLLVILFFLKVYSVYAAGYFPPAGAESMALGNIGLFAMNSFSANNHQALMPWQKKAGVGLSFTNRFAMKDINQLNVCAMVPYKSFGYGFKLYEFGNSTYKEQSIGLSVAHAFHPDFSVGLGASYQSVSIIGYGYNYAVTAEASIAAKVNERLSLAFRLYNPNRAKFAEYQDERLATLYQFGLAFKVNKQVRTLLEIEKLNAFRPNVKAGIDYSPKENCHIRFGFSSLQPQFTFGFGFRHKKCLVEWATSIHQYLGISNNLSLSFEFGK